MLDNSPLVSIVIPTYNSDTYLKEAIESVLAQTYPNIELIVIDDGSTDKTQDLLRGYEGQFYYESHPNMGQAQTLNKGWSLCKGEIIGYLAADDILHPELIEKSIFIFSSHPNIVLTYPDNILIDKRSEFLRTINLPDLNKINILVIAKAMIGVGALFKKSAFENTGGWNKKYKLSPDYEFFIRLSQLGKFYHIREFLAYYRENELSISRKYASQLADEPIQIMEEVFSQICEHELLKYKEEIFGKTYFMSGRFHWSAKRYLTALKRFRKSFKLYPKLLIQKSTYRALFIMIFLQENRKILTFLMYLKNKIFLNKAENLSIKQYKEK